MTTDPHAYVADVPCPNCGSKRATATPDEQTEYECKDCSHPYDPPRVG
jgi:DNA-directed RNA polymerase subunit RPC12/RpoP